MKRKLSKEQIIEVIELLEEMHPEARCALDFDTVYHLLIAVVLSAQTTDISVNKVTPELFEKYPLPEDLAKAEPEEVERIIHTIGLYKNKTKNIINMSKAIVDEFNGEVPTSYDDLVALPGVGRKTANVVLAEAFGEQRIAVDTHVFRVANRIGLTDEKDVLKTEQALMKVLPENKWTRTHHLLIFHGRKICNARKPDCEHCRLDKICLHKCK